MKASILIPVYNAEAYIESCADSIFAQTFTDYELIFVDDSSTDLTLEILNRLALKDNRIKVICNPIHNMVEALNMGLKYAIGEYVVRMDIDDIMHPDRLYKQITFMDEHIDITVCGSWAEAIGKYSGKLQGYSHLIEDPLTIMLSRNFIIHPSVIIRKSFLTDNNIKYSDYKYAEDYKLWFEIAKLKGKFWIIPEYLIQYRFSDNQVSHRCHIIQAQTALKIKYEIISHLLESDMIQNISIIEILKTLVSCSGRVKKDPTISEICAALVNKC